jgi:hypothetical protein
LDIKNTLVVHCEPEGKPQVGGESDGDGDVRDCSSDFRTENTQKL